MTSRQRLLAVLRHENPDMIPWAPLATGTFFAGFRDYREKFATRDWAAFNFEAGEEELRYRVNFYKQIGADFMDWLPPAFSTKPMGVKVDTRSEGDRIHLEYNTPCGSLRGEQLVSDVARAICWTKRLVCTPQDFRVLRDILARLAYEPAYDTLRARMEVIGENGVSLIAAPVAPLQELILVWAGLEETVFALHDYEDEVRAMMNLQHEKNLGVYRILAESPGHVFICGNVVGTGMLCPRLFEEYVLPCLKEYAGILHRREKIAISHTSGEPIKNILHFIDETGVDGIHGFSPPPSGDIPLRELRQLWKDRMTVWGGLDPDFLARSRPEKIRDFVKRIIDEVASGGNFILGTADDIAYGTPPGNLEAVREAIRK